MKLVEKLREPVFLKQGEGAATQVERLKELVPLLNADGQMLIKQDIKKLEYGMVGENHIAYELKNTHMPLYILHDIYLEDGDLSAQIDYLVFTKKLCFVIECKNLYGNIELNNVGDFIRTIEFNGRKRKEGIYSPITQNQRHLDLIRKIKVEKQKNRLFKFISAKTINTTYKPIVVLSNPKTVLQAKFAKREEREKVIRADQLVGYIKSVHQQSKESELSDSQLLNWAQSFLNLHIDVQKDYTKKYQPYLLTHPSGVVEETIIDRVDFDTCQSGGSQELTTDSVNVDARQWRGNHTFDVDVNKTDFITEPCQSKEINERDFERWKALLTTELKAYRLKKSKEEAIKPYLVFYDSHLEDLVLKLPTSLEMIEQVSGFGKIKTAKYGPDLIEIVKKYVK